MTKILVWLTASVVGCVASVLFEHRGLAVVSGASLAVSVSVLVTLLLWDFDEATEKDR